MLSYGCVGSIIGECARRIELPFGATRCDDYNDYNVNRRTKHACVVRFYPYAWNFYSMTRPEPLLECSVVADFEKISTGKPVIQITVTHNWNDVSYILWTRVNFESILLEIDIRYVYEWATLTWTTGVNRTFCIRICIELMFIFFCVSQTLGFPPHAIGGCPTPHVHSAQNNRMSLWYLQNDINIAVIHDDDHMNECEHTWVQQCSKRRYFINIDFECLILIRRCDDLRLQNCISSSVFFNWFSSGLTVVLARAANDQRACVRVSSIFAWRKFQTICVEWMKQKKLNVRATKMLSSPD